MGQLQSDTIGSKRKFFVLLGIACIIVGALGPLIQRGGWVWTLTFVPVSLVLLLMWIFRVRRTATIDLDAEGILVRGVFIDHLVGWGDIEAIEVRRKSGDGMTFYRPTICLVNGKSFWIYGFTSLKFEEAEATVIRLNGELRQHRKRVTKAMPTEA